MPKEPRLRCDKIKWGSLAAALGLHLILFAAIAGLSVERSLPPPEEEAIRVELLAPRPVNEGRESAPVASSRSPEAMRQEPLPSPSKPSGEAAGEPGPTIRATELFSSRVLADPRSRSAREGLQQLASSERIVQLCNLEAMEQVHRWRAEFQPDFLVAYAMADTVLAGAVFRADGGAVRSKGNWYNIKYRCEVSADRTHIAAFEFSLGAAIPEDEWEAHSLTADDVSAD